MIGAMPAIAVRHERRKGQDKKKRPSHLFIGGHWLPSTSNSLTPSPSGGAEDTYEVRSELYICNRVSALQIIVGSILLGAIVLIVGLVQLVPNASDADHRYIFIACGSSLLLFGLLLTGVRCVCLHCFRNSVVMLDDPPPARSPDKSKIHHIVTEDRNTQVTSASESAGLISPSSHAVQASEETAKSGNI